MKRKIKKEIYNYISAIFSSGMAYMVDKLEENPENLKKRYLNKIMFLLKKNDQN